MSTERIDIVVSENGSRTVKRNLEDLGRSGGEAAKGVNLLQRALVGLSVGAGLTFLIRQADAYTNILNKLKLVTSGTENLRVVNDALFASANRTRASYEQTAGLFTTLSRASKSLGMNQEEMLGITETVNQAIAISGVSASTAAAGLTQLGQAFGSGTLRGDELNSILEGMPRLADAIAAGMGVTTDKLRALGAEGKITSREMAEALKGQAAVVAEEFNRMTPTVAGGITVVRNNLMKFIGDMDQAVGLSTGLANVLLFVGDNFTTFATLIGIAGLALAAWFGAGAIASVIGPMLALEAALGSTSVMAGIFSVAMKAAQGAVRGFTLALAANPIGAVAVGLLLAISALVTFGDAWKVTEDGAVSFLDVVMAGLSFVMDAVRFTAGVFNSAWQVAIGAAAAGWDSFAGVVGSILGLIVQSVIQTGDLLIGTFVFAVKAIGAVWEGLVPALSDIGVRAVNGLISLVQGGVNKIVGIVNNLPGVNLQLVELGRLNNANEGAARALGQNLAAATGDSFKEYIAPAVGGVWDALVNRARRNNASGSEGALGGGGGGTLPPGADDGSGSGRGGGETRTGYLAELARGTQNALDLTREYNVELRAVNEQMVGISDHLADNDWAPLSPTEEAQFRDRISLLQEEEAIARIRDDLYGKYVGTMKDYERGLIATNQLEQAGIMTKQQAAREMRNLRYEVLALSTDAASGLERGLLSIMDELEDDAYRAERAMVSIWQEARGPALDYAAGLQAIDALERRHLLTIEEKGRALRDVRLAYLDTQTDALSGFERGMLRMQDMTADAAAGIEAAVTKAFKNAEDALVDFLDTGKLDVSKFVDDLWKDMARAQIKENILGPIARMFKIDIPGAGGVERGTPSNPMIVAMAGDGLGDLLGGSEPGGEADPTASAWDKIKEVLGNVGGKLKSAWDGLLNGMDGTFKSVLSSLGSVFNSLGSNLSNIVNSIGNMLSSSGGGGGGASGWASIFQAVGSFFGGSYATGGDFVVPGKGGVDSQLVSLRASPGERVTVGRKGSDGEQAREGDVHLHLDLRGAQQGVEEKVREVLAEEAPKLVAAARKGAVKDIANAMTRERL